MVKEFEGTHETSGGLQMRPWGQTKIYGLRRVVLVVEFV